MNKKQILCLIAIATASAKVFADGYQQIYVHDDEITQAASHGNRRHEEYEKDCEREKENAKQSCNVIRDDNHYRQCLINVGREFYHCKKGQ